MAKQKRKTKRKSPKKGKKKEETKKEEETKKKVEELPEPKIKWKYSTAKRLLYKDVVKGIIPISALEDNQITMKLELVHTSRPEHADHHHSKFSSRLSAIRKQVQSRNLRAELDKEAFDNYVANHKPAEFTNRGFIQYEGSESQQLLQQDLADGVHNTMTKEKMWASRYEYRHFFDKKTFRDLVYQEIRTAKYLHTLKKQGKEARKKLLKKGKKEEEGPSPKLEKATTRIDYNEADGNVAAEGEEDTVEEFQMFEL